jgi:hypothetical protein
MKVYSRPEVLEDHIAPAFVISASDIGVLADNSPSNIEIQGSNGTIDTPNLVITPAIFISSFVLNDIAPEPEPLPSLSGVSEFNIRTVKIGSDGSLFSGKQPEIDFQTVLLPLIGNTSISGSLTEATVSLFADEFSSNDSVIDAIDSAVGKDRSAALVGLSSEEFERSGGAAFLTSL